MNDTSSQSVALGVGIGRVAYGLGMAVAPRLGLALFGVRDMAGPLVFLTRLFGIRDAVLGAGAVIALTNESDSAAGWGFNYYRQLGDGTLTVRYTPVSVLWRR